jgi:glycosyltransferase involved in cell wall biosynthesis
MKVLAIHRKGILSVKGGENDQLRNTHETLSAMGVKITLADSLPTDYATYDLIHYFGLDACHIPEITRAAGMPKALSTVFWDRAQCLLMDHLFEQRPSGLIAGIKHALLRDRRVGRFYKAFYYDTLHRYAEFQSVIDEIDMFLPNSEAEMGALTNFFVIADPRYRVIPNAVNLSQVDNPSDFADRKLPQATPFVVCSGSISPRKNQYSLLKAMLDIDVPLVFAGESTSPDYLDAIKRVAARRSDVFFLGYLSPPDLHSVYRAASVHALPSLHDTPGIANLEAVAHECANVSTRIGGLEEYLGPHSLYCNPFNVDHIRKQVLAALDQPPNVDGARLVRSKYTYEQVAEATHSAYLALLEGRTA